jgi:hypothetical protein
MDEQSNKGREEVCEESGSPGINSLSSGGMLEKKREKIWDYSTLSSFQTCRKKYYWEHVRNLKPKIKGVALGFGGAVHSALDMYYTGNDRTEGLRRAIEKFKTEWQDREGDELRTVDNGIKMLEWYAKKYQHEPYKVIGKPESGFVFFIGDILFGGRIDLPVEWDGNLWIMEHKTTTRLTSSYFAQYELDKQCTGYIIAAEEHFGRKVHGCIVNVMEPWKEVIRKSAKTKEPEDHFARAPITRSEMLKDRFRLNVQRIVRDIKWCEENNEWMEAEKKEVCHYYNRPCPYLQLCQFGENERVIANDYIVEAWEPFKVVESEE